MSLFLSPSVEVREVDLSVYPNPVSTSVCAMVGTATKGPVNQRTLVTNPEQFIQTYGNTTPNSYLGYAALAFLEQGNQLWVNRVGATVGPDALAKAVRYVGAGEKTTVTSAAAGPYIIPAGGTVIRLIANGANTQNIYIDEGTYTASELAAIINPQIFGAYADASVNNLRITSTKKGSVSKLEIVEIDDTIFGFGSTVIEPASIITSIPGAGNFTFTETAFQIKVKINSGAEVTIPFATGTALTVNQVVSVINTAAGDYGIIATNSGGAVQIATENSGSGTGVELLPVDYDAYTILDFITTVDSGTSTIYQTVTITGSVTLPGTVAVTSSNKYLKIRVRGVNDAIVTLTEGGARTPTQIAGEIDAVLLTYGAQAAVVASKIVLTCPRTGNTDPGCALEILSTSNNAYTLLGFSDETASSLLKFSAINEGTDGNLLGVNITGNTDISALPTVTDSFSINVLYNGFVVESYAYCVRGTANASAANYVETLINGKSKYITVEDFDVMSGQPYDLLASDTNNKLAGGKDGILGVSDADYIGLELDNTLQRPTGIYQFLNEEEVTINMIAVPGVSSAAVLSKLISLCETRRDCMAIIDPPMGLNAQQVVDWHNNVDQAGASLNTSYAALYFSWLKVYDSYNKIEMIVPPSGYVAATYARNDFLADAWYAPAGLNRGKITTVLGVEYNPSKGERDLMYGGTNAVNAIVNFISDGVVVWGQKTLLRTSTSLNRVNVRRLCLYVNRVASNMAKSFIFAPHIPNTWKLCKGAFDSLLADIQSRGGITYFRVVCDETVNTPERIARNELVVRLLIKPTKAIEFVQIDLVLLPETGTASTIETVI